MDVVERDKMEWMTDVPAAGPTQPELDREDTRYSLDGEVIPRGTSIPHYQGLHHHGDEPQVRGRRSKVILSTYCFLLFVCFCLQAAGYTLGELLPLCRSTVLQQRVLSLQTLAKILLRSAGGEEGGGGGVASKLCKAGGPLLFRYALDETTEAVVTAATQAIHAFLVGGGDSQLLLDEYSLCHSGSQVPALRPRPNAGTAAATATEKKKGRGKDEEESDMEILQRDVIEVRGRWGEREGVWLIFSPPSPQGYLKMNLLPRVRYLLEVFLLPVPVQLQLLEVLTQVARHSTTAATQVQKVNSSSS